MRRLLAGLLLLAAPAAHAERKILYYRDPMHPGYTSPTPGKAPDCGMDLEPVYAEETSGAVVRATPDQQRMIGVRLGKVEQGALTRTVRAVGRVVPDENRVYPVITGCDGWVSDIRPGTATGDAVRKGQPLATVNGHDFTTAQRTFLYALRGAENPPPALPGDEIAPAQTLAEARRYLANLGLGEGQIARLEKERQVALDVVLEAPASGVVVSRSVYAKQRFDRDVELFRIADIARVWILASLYGDDREPLRPGTSASVRVQGKGGPAIAARVTEAVPRFDPGSRALELRLTADNPGRTLLPEMLVDVELVELLAPLMHVPASAIVDSGSRKTVFVDRGGGSFEARAVATGRRIGDRVEILSGLAAGEAIVTAGGFLLDSERRMHD